MVTLDSVDIQHQGRGIARKIKVVQVHVLCVVTANRAEPDFLFVDVVHHTPQGILVCRTGKGFKGIASAVRVSA